MSEIVKEVVKCYEHCYAITPTNRDEAYANALSDAQEFLRLASVTDDLSETAYAFSSDQVQELVSDTGESYFCWTQAIGEGDYKYEESNCDWVEEYYHHLYIIEDGILTATEMRDVIGFAESEANSYAENYDIDLTDGDVVHIIADEGSFIVSWSSEFAE